MKFKMCDMFWGYNFFIKFVIYLIDCWEFMIEGRKVGMLLMKVLI